MHLPKIPCHVISCGNNRDACFYADQDYLFYLECLDDACKKYAVALHVYVLMTNPVHLLLTPQDKAGISKVMQSVGRRYVQYINLDRVLVGLGAGIGREMGVNTSYAPRVMGITTFTWGRFVLVVLEV